MEHIFGTQINSSLLIRIICAFVIFKIFFFITLAKQLFRKIVLYMIEIVLYEWQLPSDQYKVGTCQKAGPSSGR